MANVLQLIQTHLEPGGGTKSAEERGLCFGKGFALLALVCSGCLSTVVSEEGLGLLWEGAEGLYSGCPGNHIKP